MASDPHGQIEYLQDAISKSEIELKVIKEAVDDLIRIREERAALRAFIVKVLKTAMIQPAGSQREAAFRPLVEEIMNGSIKGMKF